MGVRGEEHIHCVWFMCSYAHSIVVKLMNRRFLFSTVTITNYCILDMVLQHLAQITCVHVKTLSWRSQTS